MKPYFSVGVVTYNRRELLIESLHSILNQTFADFEVIISNDYTEEKLSLADLGIDDPRFQLVNQDENLGPWRNHNFVMNSAKGHYFVWLADDDLMASVFLESMYSVLELYPTAVRIFSSYDSGETFSNEMGIYEKGERIKQFHGGEFLRAYLARQIKTVGHYGVFSRDYLVGLGGLENLGSGVYSPYNDNLLAIRAGLLERVFYIDLPLVFFRTHQDSPSDSSTSLDSFTSAQQDFLFKSDNILLDNKLSKDYQENMYHLLAWCSKDIYAVLFRGSLLIPRSFFYHTMVLERYARGTGYYYPKFVLLNIGLAFKYLVRKILKIGW